MCPFYPFLSIYRYREKNRIVHIRNDIWIINVLSRKIGLVVESPGQQLTGKMGGCTKRLKKQAFFVLVLVPLIYLVGFHFHNYNEDESVEPLPGTYIKALHSFQYFFTLYRPRRYQNHFVLEFLLWGQVLLHGHRIWRLQKLSTFQLFHDHTPVKFDGSLCHRSCSCLPHSPIGIKRCPLVEK